MDVCDDDSVHEAAEATVVESIESALRENPWLVLLQGRPYEQIFPTAFQHCVEKMGESDTTCVLSSFVCYRWTQLHVQ